MPSGRGSADPSLRRRTLDQPPAAGPDELLRLQSSRRNRTAAPLSPDTLPCADRESKMEYFHKPDHRDGTPRKSQWTVPKVAEEAIFRHSCSQRWWTDDAAWGLFRPNGVIEYLGVSALDPGPADPLVVGFFEIAEPCHGYPSRCTPGDRDQIPTAVARAWLEQQVLSPAKIRKLRRGQRCRL